MGPQDASILASGLVCLVLSQNPSLFYLCLELGRQISPVLEHRLGVTSSPPFGCTVSLVQSRGEGNPVGIPDLSGSSSLREGVLYIPINDITTQSHK